MVHLGPQGICDVLVACFGQEDKAWDELCVRAWIESLRRGAFTFVRRSLEDDLDLHLSARVRAEFEESWDDRRGSVPSLLGGGFFRLSETTEERLALWRQAGSSREAVEREHALLERLRVERPELSVEFEPEPPSFSGWGPSTGRESD